MDGAAALVLMLSTLAVILVGVESEQRVCYFGPPPEPDPDHPEDWMKQVMQEIRKRCPGKRQPAPAAAECSNPEALGMEDRRIPDERITASSKACCPASAARLNINNRWAAGRSDSKPWIRVDLTHPTVVSGVITQGFLPSDSGPKYVTRYTVSYLKQPTSNYEYVMDREGHIKEFIGNTDGTTPVTRLFDDSVTATVVRIQPISWSTRCNLRMELLGCRLG